MIGSLLEGIARWVTTSPRQVVFSAAGVTVVALFLLPGFRLEPDLENLLPKGHVGVEIRRLLDSDAGAQRTLLVVLEGEQIAEVTGEVAESLLKSDFLESVTASREEFLGAWTNALRQAPLASLPPDVLAKLEARLTGPERAQVLGELPARIAEDPFLGMQLARRDPLSLRSIFDEAAATLMPASLDHRSPHLVTKDGRIGFVKVIGTEKPYDSKFTHALLEDVESRIAAINDRHGGARFETHLIGSYSAARADEARIKIDLWWSCFAAITLIFIFLTLSTRSFVDAHLLLFPTSIALLWTLAFGNLWFGPITSIATSAAPILSGLSVDIAIHYLGRFRAERRQGSPSEAVLRTSRKIGPPLLAGMLTSVAAFASLTFTRFGGLVDFGAILALGLAFSFVATFLLLPLLLNRTAPRPPANRKSPVLHRVEKLVRSRWGPRVASCIVAGALIGWFWLASHGLEFDANPRRLRPANDPITESAAWLEGALGFSPIPVTALVPTDRSLDDCHDSLARLADVANIPLALGPHRLVPNQAHRLALSKFQQRIEGWISGALIDLDTAGLNADAFRTTLEDLDQSLRRIPTAETVLANEADVATVKWRGVTYWRFILFPPTTYWDTSDRVTFDQHIRSSFDEDGPSLITVAPFGLADDLTELLTGDLLRSAAIASLAVLVLVLLLCRGPRFGMLALVPTIVGTGVTLGGMSWLGSPIHLGNLVALPFLIGLGIDDGIHMVARHCEGATTSELLSSSGKSVWRTSVTSFIGFGSLAFASSPGLQSLGYIMGVGITSCFIASVVILPVVLRLPIFQIAPSGGSR